MSRYSADHKEKTRAAIVEAAAERIRSGGFEALGVASIMAEAGLTHGGFYAHFPSRDALLAAAVTRLFEKATDLVGRFEAKHGDAALERYVDFYLSPRHRDDAAGGCPVPALAGEASRAAPQVKASFDAGVDKLAIRIGQLTPKSGRPADQRRAGLALLGEMAGVLSLSRTMQDQRQSGDLLSAARKSALV